MKEGIKSGGECRRGHSRLTLSLILLLGAWVPVRAADPDAGTRDLTEVSLEDLMNVQVTSVSRKQQKVSKTGAAIFVITQEDIRRSGATSIPDLLRMVPGVDVAQIDANTAAISIRGFNDRLANKVLVLIDGRTVYTPTTAGVYWDQQDIPLEDIERIEVIRGPGGTVWGANAVNGVINIISKSAADTQGVLVSATAGTQQTTQELAQYGGKIGNTASYRIYGKYSNAGNLTSSNGGEAADGWHMFHQGVRADWDISPRDNLTMREDFMQTGEGQTISVVYSNALPLQRTFNDAVTVDEGDLLARWNHILSNGSDLALQVYYDRYNRVDEGVHEALNTVDVDFHHHFTLGSRHDIVWGGGYRLTSDDHAPGYGKTYAPLQLTNNLFSTFAQDEIRLTGSLWFTLGSKLEHNAYTGFEYEPSAQLVWQPAARHSVWLSAARAIRQPSRENEGLQVDSAVIPLPGGGFGVIHVTGDPDQKSEQVRDFEAGYRVDVSSRLSLDVATFASLFRDLTTTEPENPFFTLTPGPPHLIFPLQFANLGRARTYGGEIYANWNPTSRWRISPGYSLIHMNVMLDPSSNDILEQELADNTPRHQIQLRSLLNVTRNLDWDTTLYYVGPLRNGGDGPVPSYARVDTRLARKLGESGEISVVGQNLLTPRHAEFHNTYELSRTLVERSVFGKIMWRF